MANLLGALGGAGAGLAQWGAGVQRSTADRENAAELAKLNDELAGSRMRSMEKFKAELAESGRTRMNTAVDTQARGLIDSKMQGNPVADTSTWTPEQEAARNQGMTRMANDPRTRATAAAKAGYIDEAAKLDKIAESGANNVPFGAARIDGDGNVIYDNGTEYKRSLEQQRANAATTRANAAAERAGGAGGRKGDNFDEKQWDAAAKPDVAIVSLPGQMGDKDVRSPALTSAYQTFYSGFRMKGDASPNEAQEMAGARVMALRDAAATRVENARKADKKSTLTQEQAASQILTEFRAAEKRANASRNESGISPGKSGGDSGGGYGQESNLKTLASGDMGADPKVVRSELAALRQDLLKVPDEASKAMIREQIANLEGVAKKIGIDPQPAPAAAPRAATSTASPKPDAQPALDWEKLRDQAKGLDSKIAEARRDYNLATSVRGGKGVTPETKAKIKATLDGLISQQRQLYNDSETAYRQADKDIVSGRSSPSASLNSKYQ